MRSWVLLLRKFADSPSSGFSRNTNQHRYCAVLVVFISNVGPSGSSKS